MAAKNGKSQGQSVKGKTQNGGRAAGSPLQSKKQQDSGVPLQNPARLAALDRLQLVDSPTEAAFDRLTALASKVLGVPVAMVSLLTADRHFIKSQVGLGEPVASLREIPMTHSICVNVVNDGKLFAVDNAPQHPRIKDNPAIADFGVMAYAGIPLKMPDGNTLGSFCVVDTQPHEWTERELSILNDLAQSAITEIELRRQLIERKETEAEYRRISSVVSNTSDFVGIAALDGKGLFVNEAGLAMTGYTRLEDGASIATFHPPEVLELLQREAIPMALKGEIWRGETALLHKDGHPIPVSQVFMGLKDPSGQITELASIMRDITVQRETLAALRLDERAMASATVGISISDMRLPDQPLTYVNPAFERMTGYDSGEVLGKNCRFLQADERDQPALDEIRAALKEGREARVVLRNFRKDGTLFYNELTMSPIRDEAGTLTHFIGIQNDISDQVQAQKRIQEQNETLVKANRELAVARRKADEATRLKSEFLATMSHELRTPLNAIIGYTDIQLAGMSGPLTDEQRDYQLRVLANSEGLLKLINDILDLAKIEAGRTEILKKPMMLAGFINDIKRQTEGLAKEKGLEYVTILDPRLPETIIGDPDRLRQITLNLISNAIKFTETGSVTLEINKQGRDAWAITVTDTGIGIAPHAQEYVFDEFRQADGSTQRQHGGTGLGLAIVRNLALMMGGNVRLKSAVGQGSTFTVLLPMVIEVPEEDEIAEATA